MEQKKDDDLVSRAQNTMLRPVYNVDEQHPPNLLWSTTNGNVAAAAAIHVLETYGPHVSKPCIVADVDETLLLNPEDESSGKFRINPPVKRIVQKAMEMNIPMYVVTARRKSHFGVDYLQHQMDKLHYNVTKTYMMNKEFHHLRSASPFKLEARKRIARQEGCTILVNLGDQASDMFLTTPTNKTFASHLADTKYHGIAYADGLCLLSIKLPSTYLVR
jgi:hypothetical protein